MRRLAVLFFVLLAACGGDEPQERAQPRESRAQVVRSGFSIHDDQVGAGAILRVNGAQTRRAIPLRVTFFADGKRIGSPLRDVVPFCPPRTDCPWGQSLFGENLHSRWREIDRVEVTVGGNGKAGEGRATIHELDVKADADRVVVTPRGEDGTAYLVTFDGSTPRGGYSFFTTEGERGELRYSQQVFSRRTRDDVRGFFYPGRVPARVRGPVD